jgi:alkyl hydroperoxide reductase subunit AhpF
LQEVAALSDKIDLDTYDLLDDAEKARFYGINKIPATAVIGAKDYGIRFYGTTQGYEFSSLIQAILITSLGRSGLSSEIEQILSLIDVPVHLEVMAHSPARAVPTWCTSPIRWPLPMNISPPAA